MKLAVGYSEAFGVSTIDWEYTCNFKTLLSAINAEHQSKMRKCLEIFKITTGKIVIE